MVQPNRANLCVLPLFNFDHSRGLVLTGRYYRFLPFLTPFQFTLHMIQWLHAQLDIIDDSNRSRTIRITSKPSLFANVTFTDRDPFFIFVIQLICLERPFSVVAADSLVKRDLLRLPDPFAIVSVDGEQIHTTSVIKRTLNPYWNEWARFILLSKILCIDMGYQELRYVSVKLPCRWHL